MRIEFNFTSFAIIKTDHNLIVDFKNVSDFKKWFKTNYFWCVVNWANSVSPSGVKVKIKDLKNFATSEKVLKFKEFKN